MKLQCPVVKDLYVLYFENELSEEVKEAVDAHLEECSHCKKLYDEEVSFSDMIKEDKKEEPSKKLDEKLLMKLKIRRLKVALTFIICIFLIFTYSNYYQSRKNMLNDISRSERTLYHIYMTMDNIKNKNVTTVDVFDKIDDLQEENKIITRDMNMFEKKSLEESSKQLFIDYGLGSLFQLLHTRFMNNTWSEKDEKAFSQIKYYLGENSKILQDERLRLNKLYEFNKFGALAKPIDVKNLGENYNKVHKIYSLYTRYGELPDKLSPLSKEEIESKIRNLLSINDLTINLHDTINNPGTLLNGIVSFDAKSISQKLDYYISMDVYTGNIIGITGQTPKKSGDLLPLDNIENKVPDLFKKVYNNDFYFHTKYLGINYHFSSNVDIKLYTFEVYPMYKDYKVDTPIYVNFDARTGLLYSLDIRTDRYTLGSPFDSINLSNVVPPTGALASLISETPKLSGINFKYIDTVITKSKLTGKYTLIHIYENKDEEYRENLYINALSGKREFIYH